MYWIHSPNDFAVFVYHFTCKTVFVPLGAKISEPYLPHQHFTRAQFAGPDLPGAQFAAPTFSRGPICRKKSPFATHRQGQNLYWLEPNWNMCSWGNGNGIGKQVVISFLWYKIIKFYLLLCLPSKISYRDLNSGMLWDPVTKTKFPSSLLVYQFHFHSTIYTYFDLILTNIILRRNLV